MVVVEILVFVAGALVASATLFSAIRTVVVPRAEQVLINRVHFVVVRVVFEAVARRRHGYVAKDAVLARFAPTALMLLVLVWAVGVAAGFSAMLWALDVRPLREAIVQSGSSLTTLGFRSSGGFAVRMLEILEALIGLGLIALMISFLPTMYGAFNRREIAVAQHETRAGSPPGVEGMMRRAHSIGWLEDLDPVWAEWERWFIDIEETHRSYPALVFFRSPDPHRSWVTAAGSSLDSAAFVLSSVDVPWSPNAALCLRSGFLSLRRISEFFGIDFDPDPAPTDPISVEREEFDVLWDRLAVAGVPLKADRDQAWLDFRGWRVNYDSVLIGLCRLTTPPTAPWSSDRAARLGRRLRLLRRRRV